jgi:hypothetical protein
LYTFSDKAEPLQRPILASRLNDFRAEWSPYLKMRFIAMWEKKQQHSYQYYKILKKTLNNKFPSSEKVIILLTDGEVHKNERDPLIQKTNQLILQSGIELYISLLCPNQLNKIDISLLPYLEDNFTTKKDTTFDSSGNPRKWIGNWIDTVLISYLPKNAVWLESTNSSISHTETIEIPSYGQVNFYAYPFIRISCFVPNYQQLPLIPYRDSSQWREKIFTTCTCRLPTVPIKIQSPLKNAGLVWYSIQAILFHLSGK